MKHRTLKYIVPLLAALLFTACEIETSESGELSGYWHLVQIDTLATGAEADVSPQLLFWAFQHKLLQVVDRAGTTNSYFFRFTHADGSLTLYDPHLNDRMNADPAVADPTELAVYGISGLEEQFQITIDGSDMTLEGSTVRLHLRKQ